MKEPAVEHTLLRNCADELAPRCPLFVCPRHTIHDRDVASVVRLHHSAQSQLHGTDDRIKSTQTACSAVMIKPRAVIDMVLLSSKAFRMWTVLLRVSATVAMSATCVNCKRETNSLRSLRVVRLRQI